MTDLFVCGIFNNILFPKASSHHRVIMVTLTVSKFFSAKTEFFYTSTSQQTGSLVIVFPSLANMSFPEVEVYLSFAK